MASYIPQAILLFILAVNSASALKCYKCDSSESTTCNWALTSFLYDIEECGNNGFLDSVVVPKCYKIMAINNEGQEYIARGCTKAPAIGCKALATGITFMSDIMSKDPNALKNLDCVTCETDKCNSASKIAGFTLFGVLLAAFAFLF
ncbi:hypothetical protein ABEB36_008839 [Hypothenemus hampei]|uniref:Protein sleepless n=1 Tax=Hypothenemus hampei TaxID=57062 RepID=A0ABD1ENN4_HYPHA